MATGDAESASPEHLRSADTGVARNVRSMGLTVRIWRIW